MSSAIPGGEEVDPPGEVGPGLPAELNAVVQLVDCCAKGDKPPKEQPSCKNCPGCKGELYYEGQQGPHSGLGVALPVVQFR